MLLNLTLKLLATKRHAYTGFRLYNFFETMRHYCGFYTQAAKNLCVQEYSDAVNPVVGKIF